MAMVRFRWQELVVGACVVLAAGCVPEKRWSGGVDSHQPPSPPPEKSAAETAAPPPEIAAATERAAGHRISVDDPQVAARTLFYEKTLNEWREMANRRVAAREVKGGTDSWRDCLLAAEQALAGYHVLQQADQEKDLNPWQVVARDVGYYEKGCDQVLAAQQATGSSIKGNLPLLVPGSDGLRDQLRHYYGSGDYQAVISGYEAMSGVQPQAQVSREVRALYGKSLAKTGRFEDAARIYTEILAEPGQGNDLDIWELRLETGDVLLAAGRVDDARQVYEGQVKALAPLVSQKEWAEAHAQTFAEQVPAVDLERYRQLMQVYLRFDGKQIPPALTEGVAALAGRTPGPVHDLARMMLTKVRAQAQAWARGQLTEIRSLIDAHKIEQARALLDQVTAAAPPEIMGALAQLQAEVAQAQAAGQAVPGGEPVAPEAADQWQESMLFFEQQKYDEAIAGFQKFEGAERAPEAQAKIAEAVELAAQAMRRQAAALFAKAKNTFDPEAKRQTLQSSRALLEQLIAKYPQATIVAKARQNLSAIDAELGISSPRSSPQQ